MSRAPSPTAEARFAAIVQALADAPDVAVPESIPGARRFGSAAQLRVKNKIFAMLVNDRLVVKLPRQRVDALTTIDDAERFDPGHGRVMKEWLSVAPEAQADWLLLAREAMAFVGATSS